MASLNQRIRKARAAVAALQLERRVRREVKLTFKQGLLGVDRIYLPSKNLKIPTAKGPQAIVVCLPRPEMHYETKTLQRTVGDVLVWCLPKSTGHLYDVAGNVLAWERIHAEADQLGPQGKQRFRVNEGLGDARIALREAVWQTYSTVLVPAKHGVLRRVDLGLFHSSAAETLTVYIMFRLMQDGHISDGLK